MNALTPAEVHAEIEQRVADIIALGPDNPPVVVRWEQTQKPLDYNEYTFEVYGYEGDLVRVLASAYPYLSANNKAQLKSYLDTVVQNRLLNPAEYVRDAANTRCLVYGEPGIQAGDDNC